MAKNKKRAAKTAKRAPAKAKKVAKVKKAAPKSKRPKKVVAKKPAAKVKKAKKVAKKVVAKKAAPKKQAKPAKVVNQKAKPSPKAAEKPKEIVAAPRKVTQIKPAPPVQKTIPPQLNIFPIPNQRPIAHRPMNAPTSDDRTKYSEEELLEFESLINRKLEKAKDEYKILKETLNRNNDEGTDSTSGGNTKVLEDGAETAEKENLSQLAARQQKYIMNLENALVRIKNGTYGICSVTGKLIPKERLIAVPHTTQSIEAKMMQQD
jgi:RNA polymerase-binding transcription factor DksA